MRLLICGLVASLSVPVSTAAVIMVGEGEAITRIADAARIARDGDLVLIKPGTYRGDVTVWEQHALEIRGLSPQPTLIADGKIAEGKAIWVFRNGRIKVGNLAFRGARAADGNGAAIRFERGALEIQGCTFEDNQMGVLTGNVADASLIVRDSVFANAPAQSAPLPHLLYVGRIDTVHVEGSRFEGGHFGHLIKSRARTSVLRYNFIVDGPAGRASYEIDLPDGGDALLVGNVIGQSPGSENLALIAFGAEGPGWQENRLRMSHNTLINENPQAAHFLRAWPERLTIPLSIVTLNNLIVGEGFFDQIHPGDHAGNQKLPAGYFAGRGADFTLPPSSPLRGKVMPPATPALIPTAEFTAPAGSRALAPPALWAPGAFQRVPANQATISEHVATPP